MSKSERLQVLIEPEQSARLRRAAADRGVSVATVVRSAIQREIGTDDARRRDALREILAAEPIPVPEDPAELAAEIETLYDADTAT